MGASTSTLYASDGRGFFIKTGTAEGRGQAVALHNLSDSQMLADYAQEVRLPE